MVICWLLEFLYFYPKKVHAETKKLEEILAFHLVKFEIPQITMFLSFMNMSFSVLRIPRKSSGWSISELPKHRDLHFNYQLSRSFAIRKSILCYIHRNLMKTFIVVVCGIVSATACYLSILLHSVFITYFRLYWVLYFIALNFYDVISALWHHLHFFNVTPHIYLP